MIGVLVADDQAMVRGALVTMLDLEPDITVLGQVGSGEEVVPEAHRCLPDVVLLDVQMPGKDGLTVTGQLHEALPACRILICTTFGRPGYLTRAMAAGACGFLVKDSPPEQLADAVRRAHNGLRVVDPDLAAESLVTGPNPLTDREREVLATVADGSTVAKAAKSLHLSEGTVRNHLSAAIGKTGADTRGGAHRIAEQRGWL